MSISRLYFCVHNLKQVFVCMFQFFLEIRFYDSCHYPDDPPMVLFSCPVKEFPPSYSLKLTTRLMQEAKALAKDSLPSIFSLISLLEDSNLVETVIAGPEASFRYMIIMLQFANAFCLVLLTLFT